MGKIAYVFPGQAAQFTGMGKDMFEHSALAKQMFEEADDILGFSISEIMFRGSDEDLKKTNITQPAVFLHSVIKARMAGENFAPDAVAGHSLGEISALVAAGCIDYASGLRLVQRRAEAMQLACLQSPGAMAAILGLEDGIIEEVCASIDDIVVPANYNCPGQLVISGTENGVKVAIEKLLAAGAKRALLLPVGGAFHSSLMEPAKEALQQALEFTEFRTPVCPVYQNVDSKPNQEPKIIQSNLIKQLTAPVLWTQIMKNMIIDGVDRVIETGGSGSVLRGFFRQIDRKLESETL